jgi:hypothetical protein
MIGHIDLLASFNCGVSDRCIDCSWIQDLTDSNIGSPMNFRLNMLADFLFPSFRIGLKDHSCSEFMNLCGLVMSRISFPLGAGKVRTTEAKARKALRKRECQSPQ